MTYRNFLRFAFLFLMIGFIASSCSKIEETTDEEVGMVSEDKKLVKGNFTSGAHATSGEAFVYDDNGTKKLGFVNFKTDSGPDLRIYLAEDTKATNFVQVSGSVSNGTYSVDLPANADFAKKKHVLIWCKAFSVLFGSAELK
ncbi:MAG: DM13 domain-containing protein [Saprospiraceae bacterium]|nr:DM13 domain-containing protein [Saprospiraceae bacterium]